jgi:enoyl-CoA hydratase
MSYQTILYRTDGPIAEIHFNRPHRLNAVVTELYRETIDALAVADADDEVRVIVLTGEGRAFCVGADLKEHGSGKRTELQKLEYLTLGNDVCERIRNVGKVVIAAVNGYALGAGAEMTCATDFVLMKQSAQLGFPEVSIGTHLGGGVTEILPRLVGLAKARELIIAGERVDGAEAVRIGLATRVFPDASFEQDVASFARMIAGKAPYSMRFAKALLNDMHADFRSRLTAELSALRTCMLTEDWKEGVAAFAEKRTPVFRNR